MKYKVVQVITREMAPGYSNKRLVALERIINEYAAEGYRLHTITIENIEARRVFCENRYESRLVFEKID